jgi:lysozyme family protein
MTPKFKASLARTAQHEAGYSNHPSDPGGETMYGITLRVARKWGYLGQMRFLPKSLAEEIFYKEYWLPIRGDDLPFPLAYQLFDMSVNSGPPQTTKLLQRILGVKDDGDFGPVTLSAAIAWPDTFVLASAFLRNRLEFYKKLPTWPTFGRGWADRSLENALWLVWDARNPSGAS